MLISACVRHDDGGTLKTAERVACYVQVSHACTFSHRVGEIQTHHPTV